MRFAIADPPYLGRAHRHYGIRPGVGVEFGSGPSRAASGRQPSKRATSEHPDASEWDQPERHQEMVDELVVAFDGFAIAMHRTSLSHYLAWLPDAWVAVWHDTRMPAGGARIVGAWEPVLVQTPKMTRRGRGMNVRDVLVAPHPEVAHLGAKPRAWTAWVIDMLGVGDDDEVVDMFPGSGLVAAELAQGRFQLAGDA